MTRSATTEACTRRTRPTRVFHAAVHVATQADTDKQAIRFLLEGIRMLASDNDRLRADHIAHLERSPQ